MEALVPEKASSPPRGPSYYDGIPSLENAMIRVRRVLRSRHLFRWTANMLGLAALLSGGVLVVDGLMRDRDIPMYLPMSGQVVTFGMQEPNALQGLQATGAPFFRICPLSLDVWEIGFHYAVETMDIKRTLPPMIVVGPPDLFQMRPERRLNIPLKQPDNVEETGIDFTSVEVIEGGEGYLAIRLQPLEAHSISPDGSGPYWAYYGVHFRTRTLSLDRDGLDSREFNFSYVPPKVDGLSLTAGTNGAAPAEGLAADAVHITTCRAFEMPGYDFVDGTLAPSPDTSGGGGQREWSVSAERPLSLSGRVEGGPWRTTKDVSKWVLINTVAALIGALYGASLQPVENGQATSPKRSRVVSNGLRTSRPPRRGNRRIDDD